MLLKPRWNWITGLDNFLDICQPTVTSTKSNMPTLSKTVAKGITVSGIEEFMKMSRELPLYHYSTVTIEGIYSNFLQFLFYLYFSLVARLFVQDMTLLNTQNSLQFQVLILLPLRLKPVKGLGLASLHGNKSVSVYDNCLPLFSKVNRVCTL